MKKLILKILKSVAIILSITFVSYRGYVEIVKYKVGMSRTIEHLSARINHNYHRNIKLAEAAEHDLNQIIKEYRKLSKANQINNIKLEHLIERLNKNDVSREEFKTIIDSQSRVNNKLRSGIDNLNKIARSLDDKIDREETLYATHRTSIVRLTNLQGNSGGTGFQIKAPSGQLFILTNKHVCDIAPLMRAENSHGRSQVVKVIKKDDVHDLCIVEPFLSMRPLAIAPKLVKYEKVFLIGHPGLRDVTIENGRYVSDGYLPIGYQCAKDKKGSDILAQLFNVCLRIMPVSYINVISYGGNSGSPVVNFEGKVVGVLFAGNRGQPTATYMAHLKYVTKFLKDK